jgi:hypothetical protein
MKLHDLILRDFRLKLFCLLIAWLLWETIYLGTRPKLESPAPAPSWSPLPNPLSN